MAKYNTLIEGKHLTDIALNQSGFNYYSYVGYTGGWVIMRETVDEDGYRFALGTGNYANIWTNRATQTYKRIDEFNIRL